jgi:tetratricopeptide (TPR) repeat protein
MGRGVWDDLARNQAASGQPVLTAGRVMPMLAPVHMNHVPCPFLLHLLVTAAILAASSLHAQESAEACLREYPTLYTLETGSTPEETAAQRVARTHGLLATKLKMTPEAVAKILPPLAKKLHTDKTAPKFDRACASFVEGFFVEAQTLALEAGDTAHRTDPRQPGAVISALRLAAFSAMEQGQQEAALKFISVALGETSSDRDLPTWTQLQTANARAFAGLKMLKDEEQTLRYIYTEHERILGARHADTVRHHSTLAGTLYQHGHDAEAERETRAVLKSTLLLHGPKHEQTQVVQKNLARVLEVLGRHAEAESLRREVLAAQMEMYGGGTASTLRSREQLVKNLFEQKKYAEAEAEALILVGHSGKVNGPDSATTLGGRISVALAIVDQGRHEQALEALRALQTDCIRVLGDQHPDTLGVMHAAGACLNALQQYDEAEKVLTQAAEGRKRVLPADDLATMETQHQLGIALLRQKKFKAALKEIRIALTSYQTRLQVDDPRLKAANQTASEFNAFNEGKKILIDEQRAALDEKVRELGADHLDTLNLRAWLANFAANLQAWDISIAEYEKVLEGCLRVLGQDHAGTVEIMRITAKALHSAGRNAEAENYFRKVLKNRARHVKAGDIVLEETRYLLGVCIGQLGRIKEAQEFVEASYLAVKDRKDVNSSFLAEMKHTLDQIRVLRTPQPIDINAPGTLQQPVSLSSTDKAAPAAVIIAPGSATAIPTVNPETLVPSGTIQKPVEYKP